MGERFRLRHERRRRVLHEHEPAVQTALGNEERGEPVRERGVEQPVETAFADARHPDGGGCKRVHRDRHGLAVEVPSRHDVPVIGEHDRVVGDRVELDLEDPPREPSASRDAPCTCGAQRSE